MVAALNPSILHVPISLLTSTFQFLSDLGIIITQTFFVSAKPTNGLKNDILGAIPLQPVIYTSGSRRNTRSARTGRSTHQNIRRPRRPNVKTIGIRLNQA